MRIALIQPFTLQTQQICYRCIMCILRLIFWIQVV